VHILPAVACAAVVATANSALGQTVVPCGDLIDITMVSEPWESYSRSYAEGAIRLFEAYVAPTMVAGALIGVLHPQPGDPHPQRVCSAVVFSDTGPQFFAEAMIADAEARYDPVTGLTIRVPVRFPDGQQPIEAVWVTVNQATGEVTAR
jgi:hypothetical protein